MLGGEAPKLDQPRLALVQLQTEAREPLAKLGPEPLGLVTMLKAHHEVIREPRHDDIAASVPRTPLVNPQVEHVMEVDVRKQRRNRAPCGVPSNVCDHSPSSMTPAFNHLWIRRRTLLSAIRCSRNFKSHE